MLCFYYMWRYLKCLSKEEALLHVVSLRALMVHVHQPGVATFHATVLLQCLEENKGVRGLVISSDPLCLSHAWYTDVSEKQAFF